MNLDPILCRSFPEPSVESSLFFWLSPSPLAYDTDGNCIRQVEPGTVVFVKLQCMVWHGCMTKQALSTYTAIYHDLKTTVGNVLFEIQFWLETCEPASISLNQTKSWKETQEIFNFWFWILLNGSWPWNYDTKHAYCWTKVPLGNEKNQSWEQTTFFQTNYCQNVSDKSFSEKMNKILSFYDDLIKKYFAWCW